MSRKKLIPERLTKAREKMGITKAEASRRVGLSNIGYNRYESGERSPSVQTINSIAECLNTSVDFLVGVSDDSAPLYLQIDRKEAPALFKLVNDYKNGDEAIRRRILAYAAAFYKVSPKN